MVRDHKILTVGTEDKREAVPSDDYRPYGSVILSAAKNLSERPFTEFILSDEERCFVSLSMTWSEGFRVTYSLGFFLVA
jgi:hypothetical protein